MKIRHEVTRRQLLAATGAIIASSAVGRVALADAERLSESDPTALSLGYAEDASKVDTAKWTKKAGPSGARQVCANCSLYSASDDEWGSCSIFPGKLVAGAGWCNAWVG